MSTRSIKRGKGFFAISLALLLLLSPSVLALSGCSSGGKETETTTTPETNPETQTSAEADVTESDPAAEEATEPATGAVTDGQTEEETTPETEPETEPYVDDSLIVLYDFSDIPESVDWDKTPFGIANPLLMTDNDKKLADSGWALNVTLPSEAAWCQSFTLDVSGWEDRQYVRLWVDNSTGGSLSVGLTLYTAGQSSSACPKAESAVVYTSDGRRIACEVNDCSGMGAGVNTSVELPAGFRGWVAFKTDQLTRRRTETFLNGTPVKVNIDVRPVGFVSGGSYTLDELVLSDRPDGAPRGEAIIITPPAGIAEKQAQISAMMTAAQKDKVVIKEYPEFDPDGIYAGIKAITYDGVDRSGKKTKIFAYVGYPKGADASTPAIVLIHGGGGHSFLPWMKEWMDRGYAVIAPDVTGYFPTTRNAGQDETQNGWAYGLSGVFAEAGYTAIPNNDGMGSSNQEISSQWMYHALAAAAKAFSLLSQSGRCDPQKIGVTGISWGGVITSLYIGYDPRPAFAIPVYGTAYLDEALAWIKDNFAGQQTRALWSAADRLDQVKFPVLWLVWNDDNCFSLNSATRSYLSTRAVAGTRLSAVNGMMHGHSAAWVRPESYAFADSIVKGSAPLPSFVTLPTAGSVECTVENAKRPRLYYITETMTYSTHTKYGYESTFMDQTWKSVTLSSSGVKITGQIPADAVMYYIEVTGSDGVVVTSPLITVKR